MIEATDLTKWYGPTRAVDHVSFTVPEGQIVGFLGPNGAGKSTTIRMLTGFLPPTSGTATVAGHNILKQTEQARAAIGYLPESTPLYLEMRVEEYLHYHGRLYNMPRNQRRTRIDHVVDRCGLSQVRRRVIGHLSKGNRQRVGLAQALMHEPPVLILDEPTAGLDPNQIGAFRRLIRELKGKHTILLSSHILPEIEKTADRVMVIAAGRKLAEGTIEELRREARRGAAVRVEAKAEPEAIRTALSSISQLSELELQPSANGWCIALAQPTTEDDLRAPIARTLNEHNIPLRELTHDGASLEALFVRITAEQETAAVDTDHNNPDTPTGAAA